jgi:hypothetical protein
VKEANELLATPEAKALKGKLEALSAKVDHWRQAAERITDRFPIELPDPDVEDLGLGSFDWLLDTDRGYIEQLNAYRRHEPIHRRRPPLEVSAREGCLICGGDMAGRPSKAKYCSTPCYQRSKFERRRKGRAA